METSFLTFSKEIPNCTISRKNILALFCCLSSVAPVEGLFCSMFLVQTFSQCVVVSYNLCFCARCVVLAIVDLCCCNVLMIVLIHLLLDLSCVLEPILVQL